MRLAVVYATLGRPDIIGGALDVLRNQTRPPDQVVISATGPADLPELPPDSNTHVVFGPKGLPAQRNTGLKAVRAAADPADIVIFFDDDFAPAANHLEVLESIFLSDPGIAGVTGHVIADGIGGPGYTFEQAAAFLAQDTAPTDVRTRRVGSLYGCNMSIRLALAEGLAFDEALPLYAWQEDVDYTYQLARRGRLIWSNALTGVHLGVKRARTPGLPMGYAQIANPIFLRRKRTMSARHAYTLMARNLAANLIKSLHPEPWCDRRGRVAGNLRALRDLVAGTLHPGNILRLRKEDERSPRPR